MPGFAEYQSELQKAQAEREAKVARKKKREEEYRRLLQNKPILLSHTQAPTAAG